MQILSIADPLHPVLVGGVFACCAQEIVIAGDRAYLISSEGGSRSSSWLDILDVSNPAHPAALGTCSPSAVWRWPAGCTACA